MKPVKILLPAAAVIIILLIIYIGYGHQNSDASGTADQKAEGTELPFDDISDLSGYTIILHTNDSHGRAVPDPAEGQMGFTAVSALKKYYEAEGAEVLLLDAGDTFHGLSYAVGTEGADIVDLMNLAGYDAMAPGNNDFNYGAEILRKRAGEADFAILSSNIIRKSGGTFLKDHIILEKNHVKYGIFGLTTTDTVTMANPRNIAGLTFRNPVDTAKEEVSALKADGAEVIIALTHLGVDEDSEFTSRMVAEEVDGIDVIVDGHSHSAFEEGLPINHTLIVSAGQYIENIGAVLIDPQGGRKAALVKSDQFREVDPVIDKLVKERFHIQ